MKILKIDDHKGYCLTESGEYIEVDKIDKNVLYHIVNLALEGDVDYELDEFDQDLLPNQAHQIIYKNIHEKISQLLDRRDEFLDQSERAFLDAYERYSSEAPQQGAQPDATGAG
jgi:hypothetical protein